MGLQHDWRAGMMLHDLRKKETTCCNHGEWLLGTLVSTRPALALDGNGRDTNTIDFAGCVHNWEWMDR